MIKDFLKISSLTMIMILYYINSQFIMIKLSNLLMKFRKIDNHYRFKDNYKAMVNYIKQYFNHNYQAINQIRL